MDNIVDDNYAKKYKKEWDYFKMWLFVIGIITLLYVFVTIFTSDTIFIDNNMQRYYQQQYVRNTATPAYPPPLVNFIDPPNVYRR